jgi:hypothetical protein
MNRSTIMNRRCRTTLAVVSAFLPLTGTTVAIGAVTARPAFARAEDDAKPVAVSRSPLVGIALPDGAFRLTDEATLKKVAGWIKLSDGSENQFTLGEPEVLLWGGKGHSAARGRAIKAGLASNLKAAGFNVEVAGEKQTDEGLATLFVAAKSGAKKGVLGFYLASDDYLLLAWADMAPKMAGTMGAARGDAPTTKPGPKPTAAEQKKLSAALAKAVEDGTADEVSDLLARGANPNGNTEGGQSYVQRLIIKGEKEKLAALLEAGADPNRNVDGDGFTPLVTAALTGKVEIIDLLIDKGARVNAARPDGSGTVLHAAAAVGREESVKRLLARGADPKITSKSGKTAREVAEQSGHPEIAELLRKAEEGEG